MEETANDYDALMLEEGLPDSDDSINRMTQQMRFGLFKKHVKESDNPKMLGHLIKLTDGLDKQVQDKRKLEQEEDSASATRDLADKIFNRLLKTNVDIIPHGIASPELDPSGVALREGEIKQGDDTVACIEESKGVKNEEDERGPK